MCMGGRAAGASATSEPGVSGGAPYNAAHRVDPSLIRAFLDMCDRGFAGSEPESLAHWFLRTRAAKAMWELMVLPEFASELMRRKRLMSALVTAASRLTKVPVAYRYPVFHVIPHRLGVTAQA